MINNDEHMLTTIDSGWYVLIECNANRIIISQGHAPDNLKGTKMRTLNVQSVLLSLVVTFLALETVLLLLFLHVQSRIVHRQNRHPPWFQSKVYTLYIPGVLVGTRRMMTGWLYPCIDQECVSILWLLQGGCLTLDRGDPIWYFMGGSKNKLNSISH